MRLKLKCGSCRALDTSNYTARCMLGYKVETTRKVALTLTIYDGKPQEPCPKPLTNDAFTELILLK